MLCVCVFVCVCVCVCLTCLWSKVSWKKRMTLLICMSIPWTHVISLFVHAAETAGRLACWPTFVLFSKSIKLWRLCANFSTKFFHTYCACGYHWLVQFCSSFQWLSWGSEGQGRAEHVCFIFWHTFELIRGKYDVTWSSSSWISWYFIWVRLIRPRIITALIDCIKKGQHWHAIRCL